MTPFHSSCGVWIVTIGLTRCASSSLTLRFLRFIALDSSGSESSISRAADAAWMLASLRKLSKASKCGTFAFLRPSPFFEVELMVLFRQNFTKPRSNLESLTKGAPAFSTVVGSHALSPLLVTTHFCSIFTAACSSPESPSDGLEPRADIHTLQCEPLYNRALHTGYELE